MTFISRQIYPAKDRTKPKGTRSSNQTSNISLKTIFKGTDGGCCEPVLMVPALCCISPPLLPSLMYYLPLHSQPPALPRSFTPSPIFSYPPALARSFTPPLFYSYPPAFVRSFTSSLLCSYPPALARSLKHAEPVTSTGELLPTRFSLAGCTLVQNGSGGMAAAEE